MTEAALTWPLLTLLCRSGTHRFALPAGAVTRVLGAAAFTRVSGLPGAAVGLVNVAGENLPLVDARRVFGQAVTELNPEQRFVEFDRPRRWLLWVDAVESALEIQATQCDALSVDETAPARFALRLEQETVPLLDLARLEPGELVRPVSET
jgi:chemotaxis signal transduction protein